MRRRPPSATPPCTLFPYTTPFRAASTSPKDRALAGIGTRYRRPWNRLLPPDAPSRPPTQIGRAHVCTPVTNAHLVCRLLLDKNNTTQMTHLSQLTPHSGDARPSTIAYR